MKRDIRRVVSEGSQGGKWLSHSIYRRSEVQAMNRLCTGVCVIMLVTFSACRENSPSVEETGTREAFKSVVKHNADWVPIEQEFNGVTMVLVPMGCFDMGNDPYIGNVDIHKGGRQCFDTPF